MVLKKGADLLDRLAGQAVDDAARIGALADELQELALAVALVAGMTQLEGQIGPVEAGDDSQGVAQAERCRDVAADRLGGRGGERADGRAHVQLVQKTTDLLVGGAEVVAPLRDAVGLVHSE